MLSPNDTLGQLAVEVRCRYNERNMEAGHDNERDSSRARTEDSGNCKLEPRFAKNVSVLAVDMEAATIVKFRELAQASPTLDLSRFIRFIQYDDCIRVYAYDMGRKATEELGWL